MSFYTSRAYLDAAAAVYFKGRSAAIEDVAIGNDVLRLLVIEGRRIITQLQFLDVHQPIAKADVRSAARTGRYAQNVARGSVRISDLDPSSSHEHLAPYIDWSQFASFEDYQSWLLQRHRGIVRDRERRGRSLAAAYGELSFTLDDKAEDVLPSALKWKSGQLLATDKKDYCAKPETLEFLHALREKNALVSSTLRAGGRLVSVWIGYIHDGSWSGWIFTYDPEFRKYSAGHQLLNCMLAESFRLGHREFDFSEGAEDYKMIYATHARILDEIGQRPFLTAVKSAMRKLSPEAFQILQKLKKSVASALSKFAAGLRTAKTQP